MEARGSYLEKKSSKKNSAGKHGRPYQHQPLFLYQQFVSLDLPATTAQGLAIFRLPFRVHRLVEVETVTCDLLLFSLLTCVRVCKYICIYMSIYYICIYIIIYIYTNICVYCVCVCDLGCRV